jgi:putative flippase GtrA
MDVRPAALMEFARSPLGKKLIRYSLTSVVAVIVGQGLLLFFQVVVDWSPANANLAAVCLSAIPSYLMNRYWAWEKRGRNHLLKEVAPFWGLAVLGLVFSTWAVDYVADHHSDAVIVIQLTALSAFGVLWVGKFIVFNELMFKHHPQDLPEALDGRTGIPT